MKMIIPDQTAVLMTREEAKEVLQEQIYKCWCESDEKGIDALNVAISLLCQQPCEDCISRQAAIDTIESWLSCDDYNKGERNIMRVTQSVLYDLPPVTPKPCEDCISRAEALKHSHIEYDEDGEGHRVVYFEDIENLPSVTPTSDADGNYESGYNCGYTDAMNDMAESEDKE